MLTRSNFLQPRPVTPATARGPRERQKQNERYLTRSKVKNQVSFIRFKIVAYEIK